MKKFIFFSLPVHGHTNPTLTIAQELVKQGHSVLFFSTEEFQNKIEVAGVTYRNYKTIKHIDGRIGKNVSKFAELLLNISEKEVPLLLDVIKEEKPDCIAYDILAVWGKIVGRIYKVPSVSFITTFALNSTMLAHYPQIAIPLAVSTISNAKYYIRAVSKYKNLLKKYQLNVKLFDSIYTSKEKLNIVFTSSYFQPYAKTFDNSFKFVGPAIFSRNEINNDLKDFKKNKKLIYISLGTIFNDNLDFYHTCIEAFRDSPYQLIISIGNNLSLDELQRIPPNMVVKNYVSQLEILQKADLFITHAGMNSINESIYFGVPMIAISQTYEQKLNAIRIKQLNAGLLLDKKKLTQSSLKKASEEVLNTNKFYKGVISIQETLKISGGYKRCTQEILNYLKY